MEKLSQKEIENGLESLNGWSYKDNYIVKNYQFDTFFEAYSLLCKAAFIAEKMNHHPEWSGVYNKVTLKLNTHDSGGVTQKDIDFALKIEESLGK